MRLFNLLSSLAVLSLLTVPSLTDEPDKTNNAVLAAAADERSGFGVPLLANSDIRDVVEEAATTTKPTPTPKKPPATNKPKETPKKPTVTTNKPTETPKKPATAPNKTTTTPKKPTVTPSHTATARPTAKTNSFADLAMPTAGKAKPTPPKPSTSCKKRTGGKKIKAAAAAAAATESRESQNIRSRAPAYIEVHETETVTGNDRDELYTWQLVTCAGITAYDPDTHKKVMAHITAWDKLRNEDYRMQLHTFVSTAQTQTGANRQVTLTLAPFESAPPHTHDQLDAMNHDIQAAAFHLDPNAFVFVRNFVQGGSDMYIAARGEVTIDDVCYG